MDPFLQLLLDMVGWRGTYRIASAVLCLVCVSGAAFVDPSENDQKRRKIRIGWWSVEKWNLVLLRESQKMTWFFFFFFFFTSYDYFILFYFIFFY